MNCKIILNADLFIGIGILFAAAALIICAITGITNGFLTHPSPTMNKILSALLFGMVVFVAVGFLFFDLKK